jgi:hypothetical protein
MHNMQHAEKETPRQQRQRGRKCALATGVGTRECASASSLRGQSYSSGGEKCGSSSDLRGTEREIEEEGERDLQLKWPDGTQADR